MNLNDAELDELVRAACKGNREARDKVGPWLSAKVRELLAKNRKSSDCVDDLCQQTMVVVWDKVPGKQPATADELLRLALGVAWTSRKGVRSRDARKQKYQAKLQLLDPEPTWSPTSAHAQRVIADRYLPELTTPVREIVLWTLKGGTLAQFARERDIKASTVRSRYRSAIKHIRERLAEDGLTPSQFGL